MRKFLTLTMAGLLALSIAISAVGCAQKQEEAPATPEPSSMESTPMDSMSSPMDSTMMDSTSAH